MKKLIGLIALLLIAAPAHAVRITNLDNITHRVELYGRGESVVYEIAPDETEYLTGSVQGFISLLTAQNPKPSRGTFHADGLLSDVIGHARTEGIPTDIGNNYVIWPGGRLMLQSRISSRRRG